MIALKGNQGMPHEDVQRYWEDLGLPRAEYDEYETVEKGHGRIEIRRYRATEKIEWLAPRENWKGLRSIVMVEHQREIGYPKSVELRYCLTSLKAEAREIANAIRTHWYGLDRWLGTLHCYAA